MSREPYGDPEVDRLYDNAREYIVANMMDGNDGGHLSAACGDLADEIAELLAIYAVEYARGELE